MLNILTIMGRLVSDPKIIETEDDRKACEITLAVPRSYKNIEGIYETDFISVTLFAGVMENVCKYCHKGDLVAVKGRVAKLSSDTYLKIIAERVSCLQSKTKEEE